MELEQVNVPFPDLAEHPQLQHILAPTPLEPDDHSSGRSPGPAHRRITKQRCKIQSPANRSAWQRCGKMCCRKNVPFSQVQKHQLTSTCQCLSCRRTLRAFLRALRMLMDFVTPGGVPYFPQLGSEFSFDALFYSWRNLRPMAVECLTQVTQRAGDGVRMEFLLGHFPPGSGEPWS